MRSGLKVFSSNQPEKTGKNLLYTTIGEGVMLRDYLNQ